MTDHKHEALIGSNGLLKCRDCGEILTSAEKVIAKVSSKIQAIRVLNEIAVAGGYTASGFNDGFIVYLKNRSNFIVEEITAQKASARVFLIKKTLKSIDNI